MDIVTAAALMLVDHPKIGDLQAEYALNNWGFVQGERVQISCRQVILTLAKWAIEDELKKPTINDVSRLPNSSGAVLATAVRKALNVHPKNRNPIREIVNRRALELLKVPQCRLHEVESEAL